MLNDLKWDEFNFIDVFQICEGFYNKRPIENRGKFPAGFLSSIMFS